MTDRTFVIKVDIADRTVFSRTMTVGIMETSKVRAVCTRAFRRALKKAGRDEQVCAIFRMDDMNHPMAYCSSGELGGVNGQQLRQRGNYDV